MNHLAPEPKRFWSDRSLIGLLLLIALGIHAWMIVNTRVPARDSIGYIRYALMFERQPITTVLPSIEQHPGYPLSLLLVSYPVRFFLGTTPQAMVLSGQLAASLAGILLVIPMFFLGRELFDRRVAFWATLLFQCLPVVAQITSDALSDGLFLLMVTTALLFGSQALRLQSPWRFGLCGLFSGLAYFTRPEGALIAAVTFVILVTLPILLREQWSWRRLAGCTAALVACALLVAGPYMSIIGGVSVKPSAKKMMNVSAASGNHDAELSQGTVDGSSIFASTLAVWYVDGEQPGHPSVRWGLWAALSEVMHAFRHLAFFPALLGLWWFRDRLRQVPGMWLVGGLCVVMALAIWRVAMVAEYLSERHTLILVMCGSFWAAAALMWIADSLPITLSRIRPIAARYRPMISMLFLIALSTWCLPQTLRPLHANRTGYRAAGDWLAAHTDSADPILDPYAWAHFYAGRVLDEEAGIHHPISDSSKQYVVLEHSKNLHSRLKEMAQARVLSEQGTLVYRWTPGSKDAKKYHAEEVQVYEIPIQPAAQP